MMHYVIYIVKFKNPDRKVCMEKVTFFSSKEEIERKGNVVNLTLVLPFQLVLKK